MGMYSVSMNACIKGVTTAEFLTTVCKRFVVQSRANHTRCLPHVPIANDYKQVVWAYIIDTVSLSSKLNKTVSVLDASLRLLLVYLLH